MKRVEGIALVSGFVLGFPQSRMRRLNLPKQGFGFQLELIDLHAGRVPRRDEARDVVRKFGFSLLKPRDLTFVLGPLRLEGGDLLLQRRLVGLQPVQLCADGVSQGAVVVHAGQSIREVAQGGFLLLTPLRYTGEAALLGPKRVEFAGKGLALRPERVDHVLFPVPIRREMRNLAAQVGPSWDARVRRDASRVTTAAVAQSART